MSKVAAVEVPITSDGVKVAENLAARFPLPWRVDRARGALVDALGRDVVCVLGDDLARVFVLELAARYVADLADARG